MKINNFTIKKQFKMLPPHFKNYFLFPKGTIHDSHPIDTSVGVIFCISPSEFNMNSIIKRLEDKVVGEEGGQGAQCFPM